METVWISQIPNTPLDTLWIAVTETGLAAIAFSQTQAGFTAWLTRHGCKAVVYDEGPDLSGSPANPGISGWDPQNIQHAA